MNRFLFALLLVASGLRAATIKSQVIAVYLDARVCATVGADGSGHGLTMIEHGTVPWGSGSNPPAGTFAGGPFSGTNYLSNAATLAAALTSTSGSYSFSMNVSYTSNAAQIVMFSAAADQFFSLAVTSGVMRWDDSGSIVEGVTAVGLSGWHNLGYTWDGANRKFYLDGTLDKTNAAAATWDAVGGVVLGNYIALSVPFTGLINSVVITNSVETVFPIDPFEPTATPTPTPTSTPTPTATPEPMLAPTVPLSLYLKNSNSLILGPPRPW